jgi:hypothetical protein
MKNCFQDKKRNDNWVAYKRMPFALHFHKSHHVERTHISSVWASSFRGNDNEA